MAKLSSQIYSDIQAIDESDKGQKTINKYLLEMGNALVNFATAMENINVEVAGPVNSLTASSIDTALTALEVDDPDNVLTNMYYKQLATVFVKLAMEAESIEASFGSQAKTAELAASMTMTPTLDVDAKRDYIRNAIASLGASIDLDYTQKLALGASLGVSGRVWQALLTEYTGLIGNYDKTVTMTLTPTIATLHTPAP